MALKYFKKIALIVFSIFMVLYLTWNIGGHVHDYYIIKDIRYSTKMNVFNHTMSVSISGEENNATIVILPGFGSASPVIEFKPLMELLTDEYKVVTIEPLGYGVSDGTTEERTFGNIVNEVHSVVQQLHLEKYYLMAHSMGGLYSLYWANVYPEEVLGFIGIDISVAGMEKHGFIVSIGWEAKYGTMLLKILDILGITRLVSYFDEDLIINVDHTYPYLPKDKVILKALAIGRQNNKTLMEEGEALDVNLFYLRNMTFPSSVPVLNFISSENTEESSDWKPLHEAVISNTSHSEVVLIDGQHYLHLDNKEILAPKIKQWISSGTIHESHSTPPIILQTGEEPNVVLDPFSIL